VPRSTSTANLTKHTITAVLLSSLKNAVLRTLVSRTKVQRGGTERLDLHPHYRHCSFALPVQESPCDKAQPLLRVVVKTRRGLEISLPCS
jgi:hypothetical protein